MESGWAHLATHATLTEERPTRLAAPCVASIVSAALETMCDAGLRSRRPMVKMAYHAGHAADSWARGQVQGGPDELFVHDLMTS